MQFFTPYKTTDLKTLETVYVKWPDISGKSGYTEVAHSISPVDSKVNVFPTSMIVCSHPEGKQWMSMFIPMNKSGSYGISLTWWGKDLIVKGQCQAKSVSESEWYSVVKSKAVGKGYEVEQYIGRTVPLNVGQSFVSDIAKDNKGGRLHFMALTYDQYIAVIADSCGIAGIGSIMAQAIDNIVPTSNFISFIGNKGVDINALIMGEVEKLSPGSTERLVGEAFVSHKFGSSPLVNSQPRKQEPVIDREEVYGGSWGGFA